MAFKSMTSDIGAVKLSSPLGAGHVMSSLGLVQLVKHCTCIAEVMGSNLVQACNDL